jgi:small conductance mechanosensitive channel
MDKIDISSYLNMGTDAVIKYAPKALMALLVLFIGLRIIKFLQKMIQKASDKSNLDQALASFLTSLCGWVLKILLFVAVADMMGVATTSFIAVIGAAGLAIGLALQGTLANFAGGVLILIFKPFKIGDLVDSQGVVGNVKTIQIFNTILLTPENKTVIMPNGAVMNNHIINFTEEGKIRVDLSVGISYTADIKKAKDVLEAALAQDPRVLKSPAPTVAVAELGDSSVNLAVRPWCDPVVYWDVYFDTLENCKIALDKEGIGIPFPQRDVHIYNHN